MKTKMIGKHRITLEKGIRYLASRPMADTKRTDYPVIIKELSTNKEVLVISKLNYSAANSLVNKFNNESLSFSGRVW